MRLCVRVCMHVCAPVTEHSSVRHFWGGPLMSEYKCSNLLILTGFRHQRLQLTVYFSVCMIIRCDVVAILSLHIRAHDAHLSLNMHVGTCCRQQKGAATNYSVTKCVFALSLHLLPFCSHRTFRANCCTCWPACACRGLSLIHI